MAIRDFNSCTMLKYIVVIGVILFGNLSSTYPAFAADADCTAAGGVCKAACSTGETAVSGIACTTTTFACCKASTTTTTTTTSPAIVDIAVPNPLGFTSVEDFLTNGILTWLQTIIVTLAMVFFIIGALLYIMAGADEGNVKRGKAAMTAALIGLALGIGAPTFLKEIYNIFGVSGGPAGPTLVQIGLNILKFLLSIIGILTIIMLVVSGMGYMTSGGDETRAKSAKSMATYAAIGLALALAALILVRQIARFFL